MWSCVLLFLITMNIILYVYSRLSRGITRSSTCLVGKTAIITGANSGLGYQTALNLASRGCRIIMADVADMTQSKENIIKYTDNKNIVTKKLDLSSLKSVRDFASDIIRSEENLHLLINNAGIIASVVKKTDDGFDPVMQVNYFGHFLLTHLLVDLLKKSTPSRIIFASSMSSFLNNFSLENFDLCRKPFSFYPEHFMYGNSKLALIIASDIFAEKLKDTGVTSNCIHPGYVTTPIGDKYLAVVNRPFFRLITFCWKLYLFKDTWEGAQTMLHVAISKKLEQVSGKFFVDCKPFFKPRSAFDKKLCQEIWYESERFVRLQSHEKLK